MNRFLIFLNSFLVGTNVALYYYTGQPSALFFAGLSFVGVAMAVYNQRVEWQRTTQSRETI